MIREAILFPQLSQRGDGTPVFGGLDQAGEAGLAGFFFFGTNDPMNGADTIGFRLVLEVFPGFGIGLKLGKGGLIQLSEMSLFVGIDAGFFFLPQFKGFETFRAHQAETSQFCHFFDVDFAPIAVGFAGGEADFVAFFVNAFS